MKRCVIYFLALCLLACLVIVTVPEAKAAEAHIHCVCGGHAGGIGDHVCNESVTWEPWDGTTTLVDGHSYYLNDTDGVIALSATIEIKDGHKINLCLNGVSLTSTQRLILLRGSTVTATTLNICDCQEKQGSLISTSTDIAPVLHSYTDGYGPLEINLFGGNLVAQDGDNSTNSDAGVLRLGNNGANSKKTDYPGTFNMYGGSISGGKTKKAGGNVYVSVECMFNLYGGTVLNGQAGTTGGNFFVAGQLNVQGGTISGGIAGLGGGVYVSGTASHKATMTVGGTAQIVDNTTSNVYLPSGKTLTAGVVTTASVGITSVDAIFAQASDSASARHLFCDQDGYAVYYGDGQLCRMAPAQITSLSIKPATVAIGYKAQFEIPENLHSQVVSYGYDLWLEGYPIHSFKGQKDLSDSVALTLRLQNIMTADNDLLTNLNYADMPVNARTFILLADGTRLTSPVESYDLRQMLELADAHYSSFTDTQKTALQTMYTNYETIMLGWDMPNIIHAEGWTKVNAADFEAKLTETNGTVTLGGTKIPYYLLPSGKYILTEDITITDKVLRVNEEVTICLNGHRISGNQRLFGIYGTLNICDCHSDDQEGTLISSVSGESGVYAPIAYVHPGTMNIYGGHFTATGKVSHGGVLVVGSGTLNGVPKTPGTLNMFGGTVSGGQAYGDGGLVWVVDASTLNMYGGKLYDGTADAQGGAISVGGACTANLYGGEIYGCTAHEQGGGVYVASGKSNISLGDHIAIRGNTAGMGGNIYHGSNNPAVIDGAEITGGSADFGGGLYCARGSVTLKGDAVIRDNTAGNLYVNAGVPVDAAALIRGAEIYLYNMSAMSIGCSEYVKAERSDYKTATIGGHTVLIPESFTVPADVEGFQVGFGRADISPEETGLPLAGYGNAAERLSTDMGANDWDKLTVSTVAITDEAGETVLLISADLIRPSATLIGTITPAITAATGVPESNIFITFTHTHSVPETNQTSSSAIQRYNAMLPDRFAESANKAMADRVVATMETGSFEVGDYGKLLNFTRHYQYEEDGIVKYFGDNFGTQVIDDTTRHVTEADHTMHLVKFTRDGTDILMANWRVHPHMTGSGTKTQVSADIIGTTRYYFESKTGCHFIYLQGAAGNVNETSKLASEKHGLDYMEYGDALSNQIITAMQGGCLSSAGIGTWQVENYSYTATADKPTEDEYNHAKAASDTFYAWLAENPSATGAQKKAKCEELGYLTWFHFNNVLTRYKLNDTYQLPLNTFSLGSSLAFFTAPGELWDTVSMEIEEASPFAMTMCIGYSQDHYNYFVYDPTNGGEMTYESYESNNYRFVAPDTVNGFIAYWKTTLNELYANLEN